MITYGEGCTPYPGDTRLITEKKILCNLFSGIGILPNPGGGGGSGQAIIDPETGLFVIDPETGGQIIDPALI